MPISDDTSNLSTPYHFQLINVLPNQSSSNFCFLTDYLSVELRLLWKDVNLLPGSSKTTIHSLLVVTRLVVQRWTRIRCDIILNFEFVSGCARVVRWILKRNTFLVGRGSFRSWALSPRYPSEPRDNFSDPRRDYLWQINHGIINEQSLFHV